MASLVSLTPRSRSNFHSSDGPKLDRNSGSGSALKRPKLGKLILKARKRANWRHFCVFQHFSNGFQLEQRDRRCCDPSQANWISNGANAPREETPTMAPSSDKFFLERVHQLLLRSASCSDDNLASSRRYNCTSHLHRSSGSIPSGARKQCMFLPFSKCV